MVPGAVVKLARRLIDMGIDEVSISDTIGKATPDEVAYLMDVLLPKVAAEHIAVHFHDTYGRGIANVLRAVSYGIQIVDASVGGLGGCPFAPGATGNVATEEVVAALMKAGKTVAVDTERLVRARGMLDPYLSVKPGAMPKPAPLACLVCEFFDGKKCCGRETKL